MHIMYVDESGVMELSDPTTYFVTAGVIFHESDLDLMKNTVQNYKDNNFTGSLRGAEIHLYHMRKGRGRFRGLNLQQKIALLNPLYNDISTLPFTIIAVRVDKQKFARRHNDVSEILDYGYMLLTERFDYFLRENSSKGIVRIDRTTSPNQVNLNCKDSNILKLINNIRKRGTRWQPPADNIVEEPHFLQSHLRKGLQLADAVSYCVTRKSNNNVDFDTYWNQIHPKFRKSALGQIEGYGLITYPRN